MKTVYDADGNSYTVDPVDAREYIATGRYFEAKPEPVIEPPKRGRPFKTEESE